MLTKKDKIEISPEKIAAMFLEKDYLVKLVSAAIKAIKPAEAEDLIESEAIGLLNHYATLENEIYFSEKVNEMLESLSAATSAEAKVITKC